ncbi:hypothetical protein ACHAWF_016241 [Thalassiosira exigua]
MDSSPPQSPDDRPPADPPTPASTATAASTRASTAATAAAATAGGGGGGAAPAGSPSWAHPTGGRATAAAARIVSWTHEQHHLDTATRSRGLRPMHVRVSVRVHHVAFLHPGLDGGGGGRATIGGGGRWQRAGRRGGRDKRGAWNHRASAPGLLQFGAATKGGSKKKKWTPPSPRTPTTPRVRFGGGGDRPGGGGGKKPMESDEAAAAAAAADDSDVAEIVAAEAFRLSRDGIVQHHCALARAAEAGPPPPPPPTSTPPPPPASKSPLLASLKSLTPRPHPPPPPAVAATPDALPHSAMLSPRTAANPQDAMRYYRACASRPRGYRRLVVSSAAPGGGRRRRRAPAASPSSSFAVPRASLPVGAIVPVRAEGRIERVDGVVGERRGGTGLRREGIGGGGEGVPRRGGGPGRESVRQRRVPIRPPKTGPAFFRLLREHGAATFGRYLPELACSVPDHSVGFELRRGSRGSRNRCASTQPVVVEAPHVLWGDGRDRVLSGIAKEGCPLIDSRAFEYVSNMELDDAELSESLMVCGATLWVQNEEGGKGPTSKTSKEMIKAEYYGGKLVDGLKDGLEAGVKGLTKGTKGVAKGTVETAHVAKKGTKKVVEGGKKLLPIPHDKELDPEDAAKTGKPEGRRKLKVFKKMKIRRRKKRPTVPGDIDEGRSEDGSVASELDDSISVRSESDATDRAVDKAVDEDAEDEPEDEFQDDFMIAKPKEYVLLWDDIIDIRIVSFPDLFFSYLASSLDKDDVIASFPVSVASVMVQRSMEERIDDPLKPSELTATLVQEPSAQDLRWGVELKVTLRAVEVKPNVPRVMPRPKDVIDEEMKKMKERLTLLGKSPEGIKMDLRAREEEIVKDENKLNAAIVRENDGAGQGEIRLRQMFYCEREHGTISRKMKRRAMLTNDERTMLNDCRVDPSVSAKGCGKKDQHQVLEMLDVVFPGIPGIEKENFFEESDTSGLGVSSNIQMSLNAGNNDSSNTLVKASLAMASSLDVCLAGLTAKPTVAVLERQLRHTVTEGIRPHVTKSMAKEWCSSVADKLSVHLNSINAQDSTNRSTIATFQEIIAESMIPGSGRSIDEIDEMDEEMKLNEDEEVALSETKASEFDDIDSSKVLDWGNAVIVELKSLAAEMDEDQESFAHSETSGGKEKSVSPDGNESGVVNNDLLGSFGRRRSEQRVLESRVSSLSFNATSPVNIATRRMSSAAELMESVLYQKSPFAESLSKSHQRIRSAGSISTVKDARKTLNQRPDLGESHHVNNMRAASLSVTLVYLAVITGILTAGAYVVFMLCQESWSMLRGN